VITIKGYGTDGLWGLSGITGKLARSAGKQMRITELRDVLFDEIGETIRIESIRQAAIERNGKDGLVEVLTQTITDLMMHVSKKLLVKIPIRIDDPIEKLILKKLEPCKGICIKCSVGRLTGLCL
jgi:hypothetical protein